MLNILQDLRIISVATLEHAICYYNRNRKAAITIQKRSNTENTLTCVVWVSIHMEIQMLWETGNGMELALEAQSYFFNDTSRLGLQG